MLSYKSAVQAIIILLVVVLLAASCRKELEQGHNYDAVTYNSYGQVFDAFWNTMNSHYQFWDKDTTDWDAVYTRYRPLFDKLDIYNENDQRKSMQYFHEMLSSTLDGHLNIYFYPPAIVDSFVYPRLDQNELTINHVRSVNPLLLPGEQQRTPDYYGYTYYDVDKANYLDPGIISGSYHNPDFDVNALGGTIHTNILYIGFDAAALVDALSDTGDNPLKLAYNAFMQSLKNNPAIKGAIVDMRGNLGGRGQDAITMSSALIDNPIVMGETRYKNGTGRLDYTPWAPTYIKPAVGSKAIRVPLIILTDVLTFSAGEHITAALHAIPGAISVGTATRGGNIGYMGYPSKNMQGKRGGSFKVEGIGDFMDLDFSAGIFRSPDGTEPIWGLKPDYEVPFDTVAIRQGRDPQLEKALSLIR